MNDLTLIFKNDSHRLDGLSEKDWHAVFEALFHAATLDRSSYLKSRQDGVGSRLEKCAFAMRNVVEASVHRVRPKTLKSVVDHIIETLPATTGYCWPLCHNYLKCLRTILEFQPYVEHLHEKWQKVAQFCVEGIALLQKQQDGDASSARNDMSDVVDDSDDPITPNGTFRSTLQTPNPSAAISIRSATPKLSSRSGTAASSAEVEEFVICMQQLVRAPNAPIHELREDILTALTGFLKSSRSIGRAHVPALMAINSVLARTMAESSAVIIQTVRQLIPLLKDYWSSKSAPFRDEMLVSLVLTHQFFCKQLPDSLRNGEKFAATLENLMELLVYDYCKRHEKDMLQLDDLFLRCESASGTAEMPRTLGFHPRPCVTRAEACWTIALLTSTVFSILDEVRWHSDENDSDGDAPRKRARPSPYLDEHMRIAISASGATQIASLQLICFMVQSKRLPSSQLQDIIERLASLVGDPKGSIASWAMLAISSCAFQTGSADPGLQELWSRVWKLASRAITLPSCSRLACHLLNVLFRLRLVSYQGIAADADLLLISPDLNGPALVDEASAALWASLSTLQASENPSTAAETPERILRWLFSRWTPSKNDHSMCL